MDRDWALSARTLLTSLMRLVEGLQTRHDRREADILNQQFATDVAWGSPYGALVIGYDQ
jgi:hypothetical protein